MIKLHTLFEKNKLNASNKNELFLVELEGMRTDTKETKRKKLNISLCIDVSSSMQGFIDGNHSGYFNINHLMGNNLGIGNPREIETPRTKTKLELVKEASINALSIMEDGDIISIVSFDNRVTLVKEATVLTKENRVEIINMINSLQARGTTNIHGGWLRSVEEVALNVSKESLNRVIMLTDGQANVGKQNPDDICTDVANVASKNVSTSTFGVGQGFNEMLLESMSDSGLGNFYYIGEDGNFDVLFNEEFTGLSNICATSVKLNISLNKELKQKVLTEIKDTEGLYKIQDITTTSKIPVLFKLETESLSLGEHNLGMVSISFKDVDGNNQKITKEIKIEVTTEGEWEALDENQEVKVQELLNEVVQNKLKAKKLFDAGDKSSAQDVLRSSTNVLLSSNIADDRLSAQSMSLNTTLENSESQDLGSLSKEMHYQSYRTLKGKDL